MQHLQDIQCSFKNSVETHYKSQIREFRQVARGYANDRPIAFDWIAFWRDKYKYTINMQLCRTTVDCAAFVQTANFRATRYCIVETMKLCSPNMIGSIGKLRSPPAVGYIRCVSSATARGFLNSLGACYVGPLLRFSECSFNLPCVLRSGRIISNR